MTMKTKLIAAGAIIAASFAAIPAANAGDLNIRLGFGDGYGYAQDYNYGNRNEYGNRYDDVRRHRWISERRVHRILRHNGLRAEAIWRKGPFYVARAYDNRGRAFRVRLSAFDGDIVAVNRIDGNRRRFN